MPRPWAWTYGDTWPASLCWRVRWGGWSSFGGWCRRNLRLSGVGALAFASTGLVIALAIVFVVEQTRAGHRLAA